MSFSKPLVYVDNGELKTRGNVDINANTISGDSGTQYSFSLQSEYSDEGANLEYDTNHWQNKQSIEPTKELSNAGTSYDSTNTLFNNIENTVTNSTTAVFRARAGSGTARIFKAVNVGGNNFDITLLATEAITVDNDGDEIQIAIPSTSFAVGDLVGFSYPKTYYGSGDSGGYWVAGTTPSGSGVALNSTSLFYPIAVFSGYLNTDNTVRTDVINGAGSIARTTLDIKNESDGSLSTGTVNVREWVDGSPVGSLVDIDTFKAGDAAFSTSYQIEIQPIGASSIKDTSFSTLQTVFKVTQNGLEALVNSVRKSLLNNQGQLELDDSTEPSSPIDGLTLYSEADIPKAKNVNGDIFDLSAKTITWQAGAGSPETAVTSTGYLIDTTSSAYTLDLPTSPSIGDTVGVMDFEKNSSVNNITVGRAGENINGSATDLTVDVDGSSFLLVFTGASQGWVVTGFTQTV